ncbi:GNAT family N-acetyltransferase [Clostridium sp. 19966]|uniref:GNAT family N-acetyltransferase n=1 Tax=Clostridium sp. 19966 TaxID=2768166 RepID=UPI0028DF7446|nr:GNAT family N-acetyltransferase [Clostridium sp. 19966]MDT8718812.1 GNAT family N-acetyltransferase [Clostridium sp. 19966]
MDDIAIRKMDKDMLDEIVDLFISTFSREPWNDVYESREQVSDFFINHFNNNYFLGYVLIVNDRIKGLSIGMKKPWIKGFEYYIDEFCIGYDMQGKGLGSWFIKKIELDIIKEGVKGIILNTEKGFPSFEFYKKNGFEELGDLVILAK